MISIQSPFEHLNRFDWHPIAFGHKVMLEAQDPSGHMTFPIVLQFYAATSDVTGQLAILSIHQPSGHY